MRRIAIFASGTGSNFQAIVDAIQKGNLQATIALLICDKPEAPVIEKAQKTNIPVFTFSPKEFASKAIFESIICEQLQEAKVDFIVLAGYMRLIGPTLLQAYPNKIINLHPSLLPAFPGKEAIKQAVQAGVKITGITIHYVDEGMDTGPIIAQEAVEISEDDTLFDVERKIHQVEHIFYPQTLQKLCLREYEEEYK
ncbi:phosphoribosylglycinamide formyltransferase [Lederbergia galactosidilytica]|nr:phosphoribosylglycinamide formyltransferase [Lederbergia galactosidilytica]KRG14369.1 phosphoribosylglycinamide formyltransferase [Virgibacillus soli]MBP1916685.1 phosphoribosylglycinamide formyltransferase-1 [Lederbergia galactosidilytica]OAK70948.1 phosphoribosylglycinamide formyltransferase [Lederbergia galactosidilytica]